MCEPVSLGMLAVGVASSVAGFVQQGQQAKAADRSAREDYAQQTEAMKLQYKQTNQQAADEMSVRAREAMIETARLRVLGGESGLTGGSNDRIENESQFNKGTDIAALESNRRNSLNQLYQEGKATRTDQQTRINSIKRPSLIGTGLQIAGAAAGAAATHKSLKGKLTS